MSYHDILVKVGDFGLYQKLLCGVFIFYTTFICGINYYTQALSLEKCAEAMMLLGRCSSSRPHLTIAFKFWMAPMKGQ